ncbi:hypothetical protein Deipr_2374 (plasmid) [Deinococcus proteolyticus MRP]|uniref:Uncharacterized protein n=1 Tax=Deinococcus proteolyticus (strain ATCC 35074 / DSM 20540 / JCM 6276 / NBRC 101906 / NCIMB 13154 / VKM Ac-1939 / CCM 2703 / MRP) TaxID=693977 RepID=F0RQD9_DEIPM|nr:hypothetical protein [Deinococcus proteolyticus]ADY27498.1 hypothetical protein Deipr_2374 [Deinococcus proteolyticus MRP]
MTTFELTQTSVNRAAIEAAAAYTNPAPKQVAWSAHGFTLYQGIHEFPFTLRETDAQSIWHTADLSDYQACWHLSALTGNMSISPFFGVLFGLPELAKRHQGHLREGRSYSLYHPGNTTTPGQLRLPKGRWITAIIEQSSTHSLLLLGGIPAGMVTWPNQELIAYQHLSDRELRRIGLPRLSPEEQLPAVWQPTDEALQDILSGLEQGYQSHDFMMKTWNVPFEGALGNTPAPTVKERLNTLYKQQQLGEQVR